MLRGCFTFFLLFLRMSLRDFALFPAFGKQQALSAVGTRSRNSGGGTRARPLRVIDCGYRLTAARICDSVKLYLLEGLKIIRVFNHGPGMSGLYLCASPSEGHLGKALR